jgi:hypothetical protein
MLMQKQKKRIFYILDAYLGVLILPVIGIIALISELLLPWITAVIDYFKK